MKDKYRRNIFALTIHLMFSKRITGPVMMLFYQSFGLNFGQIGTLSSIAWLSDAAFEVNGGAFSDVYGRKKASLVYAFLGMLGMLLFVVGNSFGYFAAASAIYGISIAVGSGNASALLFDTLRMMKLEKSYKKFSGKMRFPAKILNGLTFLILPALFTYNIRFPFVLGFFFYLISFLTAAFFIVEPKRKNTRHIKTLETIVNSFKEIWRSQKIKQIIFVDMIFTGFSILCYEYFQPIISASHIPLAYFGIIYAIGRLFEGSGSLLLHKFDHSNRKLLSSLSAMLVLSLAGFAFFHSWVLIILIFFSGFTAGAKEVVISDLLNNNISSKNRTTIMSTNNLFDSLFVSILFFIFGHVSDAVGVQGMFLWATVSFILIASAFQFAIMNKNRRTNGIS